MELPDEVFHESFSWNIEFACFGDPNSIVHRVTMHRCCTGDILLNSRYVLISFVKHSFL